MTAARWSLGAAGPVLSAAEPVPWYHRGACKDMDLRLFFPELGETGEKARRICAGCPVRRACLDEAMQQEKGLGVTLRHGVRGGLTGPERAEADQGPRRARRSRPLPLLTDRQVERFQALLHPGGCGLTWAGPVYDGRLVFTAARSMNIGARRLAYALATGEDPGARPVRQRCGDPMCMTGKCLTTDPLPARAA